MTQPLEACYKCGSSEDITRCTSCGKPICYRERVGTGSVSDGYQCGLLCSIIGSAPELAEHGKLRSSIRAIPPPPPDDHELPIVPHEPEKTGIHFLQRVHEVGKFLLGILLGLLSAAALYELFHPR